MKVNYVKAGVYSVLGIATIYVGYRLIKHSREKRELALLEKLLLESASAESIAENTSSNKTEKKVATQPAFNGNKIISKGSKGDEAKTVQLALNNIIEDAKKVNLLALKSDYKPSDSASVSDSLSEPFKAQLALEKLSKVAERVKKIASLPKLVADGNFGAKSVSVCQVIMGTTSTTYNKVMQKRIAFSKTYGLPNPY